MNTPSSYQDLVDAEADAEGAVRLAEVRLLEVRSESSDEHEAGSASAEPTSKLVAAEEALAKAVRRLQRCRDATVSAAALGDSSGITQPAEEYSDRISPDRTPQYECAADWIEQYLVRIWRRRNVQWCAKWFLHAEAVSRLEALWRSWEYMRYEGPTAMAVWWRDYADYHLRELTARSGPFEACNHRTGEHEQLEMLRTEPAPEEMRLTDTTGEMAR